MQAHIGHRIEPLAGRRIEGAEVGQLQPGADVLFHIAHPVFHPALFIALADIARSNGKAVGGGEVQILRIAHRGFAEDTLEHGGFEIVDHHFFGHAAEELQGVLMAGQEVLHSLGDGELHIHHPAVAQDHNKEAQPSLGLPYWHGAEGAPIDLGTLAGRKGQCEKSRLTLGAYGAHVGFDEGVAPSKALLAQALKDLRGTIGVLVQHLDNLGLQRREFTGPWRGFAGSEALLAEPVRHRARIESQGVSDLRRGEPLMFVEVFDLTEAVIIDHDSTSQRRANTALMSTGSSSAATVEALVMAPLEAVSRAKTW